MNEKDWIPIPFNRKQVSLPFDILRFPMTGFNKPEQLEGEKLKNLQKMYSFVPLHHWWKIIPSHAGAIVPENAAPLQPTASLPISVSTLLNTQQKVSDTMQKIFHNMCFAA